MHLPAVGGGGEFSSDLQIYRGRPFDLGVLAPQDPLVSYASVRYNTQRYK